MKCSLMGVGLLVNKVNSVIMDDVSLKLYDTKIKLDLKFVLTKNKTTNTLFNTVEVNFFATMIQ